MNLADLTNLLGLSVPHVIVTGVWVSLLMGYATWAMKQPALRGWRATKYLKRTLVIVLPVAVNAALHLLPESLFAIVAEAGLAAGGASLGYVLRKPPEPDPPADG